MLLTIASIVFVRNFLEDISDGHITRGSEVDMAFYLHTFGFYTCVLFTFLLISYSATKRPIGKLLKVITIGWLVILVPPVVDLIVTKGAGMNMAYFQPDHDTNLLEKYLTFFGPYEERGVTTGQRTMIALFTLGGWVYFFMRNKNIVKATIHAVLIYTITFLIAISPFFASWPIHILGTSYAYSNEMMLNFYLAVIAVEGVLLFYITRKKDFMALISDMRWFRLAHCELLFFLGVLLAWKGGLFALTDVQMYNLILVPFSILCAFLYSIMTNNLEDIEIDKVTNRHRPLITKAMNEATYVRITWICLIVSLAYALAASYRIFLLMGLFLGTFYLYSMPPLRLKRITFFSKGFIAINLFTLTLAGFFTAGGPLYAFPPTLALWMLLGFTAIFNFVDLKDEAGDGKVGIQTLPVIFGSKKAKPIIGSLVVISYALAALVLRSMPAFLLLLFLGGVQYALINRKHYDEKPIFAVSLATLVMLLVYVAYADVGFLFV